MQPLMRLGCPPLVRRPNPQTARANRMAENNFSAQSASAAAGGVADGAGAGRPRDVDGDEGEPAFDLFSEGDVK
jgi:hypothetical protein